MKVIKHLLFAVSIMMITNVAHAQSKKEYKAFFSSGGEWRMFIKTASITLKEAYKNCLINHNNNPTQAILCQWDGKNIYFTPRIGTSRIYINDGSVITKDATISYAVNVCKRNMALNPRAVVVCTFANRLILSNQ